MKILTADDERLALMNITEAVKEAVPDAEVADFRKTDEVIAYVKNNHCDIAFLDIRMRGMTGLELAAEIKNISPETYIIFVTGYSEYAVDAFKVDARGYLLKPATADDVKDALARINFTSQETENRKITVQTFGNFEVFAEGKPVEFHLAKAKELFAVLVDRRGSGLSTAEIATILWEEKTYDKYMKNRAQTAIMNMRTALKEHGAEDIIVRKWNSLSVDTSKIDCDYYRFLEGDITAVNQYTGEYMAEYSWAEFTNGFLFSEKKI